LTNGGLEELVCTNSMDYIETAEKLFNDLRFCNNLFKKIPLMVKERDIFDTRKLARDLLNLFLQ
jgi:predicted O-linked N-acetylglucosamine transferase (SPINDLY family)